MKVVVAVKHAGLLEDEVEFIDDGRSVDPDYLEWRLNEWDAFATEAAIRLRESEGAGEVVVVTVGGAGADASLRRCVAVGADRAIRVDTDAVDPIRIAEALANVVRSEMPDLVLCGVQSVDSAQGATGSVLAGILDWPVATVVTALESNSGRSMTVRRELEGGMTETVALDLPAVITVQTGIHELRYASLRAVMQAEAREVAVLALAAQTAPAYSVMGLHEPSRAEGASFMEGSTPEIAEQIVGLLKGLQP